MLISLIIPQKKEKKRSFSVHLYALVIATDGTPTYRPQSTHWPSDGYWTQSWKVFSQSGKLLSDWLACSSGTQLFLNSLCLQTVMFTC